MNMAAKITVTERLGRALGRAWRGCARLDRRANAWLLTRGWAPGIAKAALLIVKLAAFGLLLYAMSWLALLLSIAVGVAWAARNTDWDGEEANQTEWRYGPAGYGLYTHDEHRIDPHDPEDERD